MKKTASVLALALLIGTTPALANDDPKTLPSNVYDQLKSGKKLDKVWLTPAFDKSKGFKVAAIEYKAEYRSSEVMDSLPKALKTLEKADSSLTLQIAIIKVSTKTFTGFGNVMGAITVEGRILDAEGKVVAAFRTKEKAGSFGSGKDDYTVAADKIATAIAADLL